MADRVLKISFLVDGSESADRVASFELTEALSVGMEGWVELTGSSSGLSADAATLAGKRAALKIAVDEDSERFFHGVILGASVRAIADEVMVIRIQLVARLHLLRLGQDVRFFQQKSVKDVVKQVLEDGGLTGGAQDWQTKGSYSPEAVLRQCAESDEAFIRRILADAGIGYAIHQTPDDDVVVLFDALSAFQPIDGEDTLQDRDENRTRSNTVWELRDARRTASDTVMLRDYDAAKPGTDLTTQEKADQARGMEVYLHPGDFAELADGKELAKRALERVRSSARAQTGQSDCPFLEPGRTFALDACQRDALNARYRVFSVVHQGSSEVDSEAGEINYANRFEARPEAWPLRPPLQDVPLPPSVEVAFVTGADGQELHGSKDGEVRVRYPWDRSGIKNDKSSPWLRVGQLALGGSMIIPRVGFEVLVDHELGEWDRPVVVGHLYNGEATPPYALPGGATVSTMQTATTSGGGGANELRFEDAAGSEEIFLNASRDLTVSAENESAWSVGNDETVEIGGNRSLKIGANHNSNVQGAHTSKVNGSRKLDVGGDFGQSVKGAATLDVSGIRKISVKGDLTESIGGTLHRTVSGLQSVTGLKGVQRTVGVNSEVKVGAAWLEITGADRSSSCGPLRKELVGALKLTKAKTVAISADAAYGMAAASEQVTCGGNRNDSGKAVMITSAGPMKIKAKNINITGENKVTLRVGGTRIEVTSSSVTIKTTTATLEGNKKVGHKTQHTSG